MFNKEEVIKNVNKSWPKDLIIRCLYVKLAPGFERDLDFFFLPIEEQIALYKKGIIPKDDIHMVCQYYQKLYASFNIESIIITTNKKIVPHYALIVKGDTCYFCIDPLKDLMRNQVGFKSGYFGFIPLSKTQDNYKLYPQITTLNPEYIKEMDEYLKLLSCGMYSDDFLILLHQSIFHRPNYRLLEFLDQKESNIEFSENIYAKSNKANHYAIAAKIAIMNRCVINIGNCPGIMERDQLYNEIVRYVFSRSERRNIKVGITPERELSLIEMTENGPVAYTESCEDGIYKLERKIA